MRGWVGVGDVPNVRILYVEVARDLDGIADKFSFIVRLVGQRHSDGSHLNLLLESVLLLILRKHDTSSLVEFNHSSNISQDGSSERFLIWTGNIQVLLIKVSHLINVLPQHGSGINLSLKDRGWQVAILVPGFSSERLDKVAWQLVKCLRKVGETKSSGHLDLHEGLTIVVVLEVHLITDSEEVDKLVDINLHVLIVVDFHHEFDYFSLVYLGSHLVNGLIEFVDVQVTTVVSIGLVEYSSQVLLFANIGTHLLEHNLLHHVRELLETEDIRLAISLMRDQILALLFGSRHTKVLVRLIDLIHIKGITLIFVHQCEQITNLFLHIISNRFRKLLQFLNRSKVESLDEGGKLVLGEVTILIMVQFIKDCTQVSLVDVSVITLHDLDTVNELFSVNMVITILVQVLEEIVNSHILLLEHHLNVLQALLDVEREPVNGVFDILSGVQIDLLLAHNLCNGLLQHCKVKEIGSSILHLSDDCIDLIVRSRVIYLLELTSEMFD